MLARVRDERTTLKRIRNKLTYANLMATAAVFIALGGASYAAVSLPKNSVGSKQLKRGAVTRAKLAPSATAGLAGPKGDPGPQGATGPTGAPGPAGPKGDPGPPATSLLAHVSAQGTLIDGSGVTGAERIEKAYAVDFDTDVSDCNLQATLDRNVSAGGEVSVSPDEEDPGRVVIETFDAKGDGQARSFYLTALCP